MKSTPRSSLYVRNIVFGVEDSLVSTVGFLSGIAVADVERATILLAGTVLIVVEGVSMAAGAFLSEESAGEYAAGGKVLKPKDAYIAGALMFCSYFAAGFVALAPYVFFPVSVALWASIVCSLIALVALGAISGALSRAGLIKSALRMVLIGGIAIAIGVAVAKLLGVS
jgi:VIT1/CCC1 family predicted Fe2+/Mn2+ transporter